MSNVKNYSEQGGARTEIGGVLDVVSGGALDVKSGGEIDIESGAALKLAGVALTATAAELNLADKAYQSLVANGEITVKNGVCFIAKTVAGAVAATLANPTATTDDYKRLLIVSNQAQANTVTVTGGFGDGGAGEDVCTFSGAVGDCIELMAYGGKWYVVGGHQFSLA